MFLLYAHYGLVESSERALNHMHIHFGMCLQRGLSDPAQLPVTEVEDSSAQTRIQIQTCCQNEYSEFHMLLTFL